jgi:hypothetical protein
VAPFDGQQLHPMGAGAIKISFVPTNPSIFINPNRKHMQKTCPTNFSLSDDENRVIM